MKHKSYLTFTFSKEMATIRISICVTMVTTFRKKIFTENKTLF